MREFVEVWGGCDDFEPRGREVGAACKDEMGEVLELCDEVGMFIGEVGEVCAFEMLEIGEVGRGEEGER